MRTTIDISPEHRARLVELAARRGDKGFSRLIAEALEIFLARQERDEETLKRALAAGGSLADGDANELRSATTRLRESWR
jgi:predicted transcriptional regulator